MPFLPGFEDDVFISYAHIDDRPLTEDQKGWIWKFHQRLETRLAQVLGADAKFFRDPELRGNDVLEDKLIGNMQKIALLVSVVTPRYIQSEWCLRELREFYKVAEQTGGVHVPARSRLFKIVKTPVAPEEEPHELKGGLDYKFFEIEKATHRPREYSDGTAEVGLKYWKTLDDVAYDIRELLKKLKTLGEGHTVQTSGNSAITIYLAEASFDLRDARDEVRRDLVQRGYTVLPDKPLPPTGPDFREAVREYLQRSRLSVHLIGENYGDIPKAESQSHVCLQTELAAERGSEAGFSRVIWMPVDLKAREDRQQQFIEYLQNDPGAQQGAEVMQNSLEDLKTIIGDKLAAKQEPDPRPAAEGPLRIYLICDKQDFESISPLEDYLYNRGYELFLPALEGDEAQVREEHKENLLMCDACIIYYGKATDFWLRAKLRDLLKIAGYGRPAPIAARAIYVAGPETEQKQRLRTHEATVIKDYGGFSPDSLRPFLDQLESVKGGR